MIKIGLIREGKIPADNRVALIPSQCKWRHGTRFVVGYSTGKLAAGQAQRHGDYHRSHNGPATGATIAKIFQTAEYF